MGAFKWRLRHTKYFGDTWVPFAQVDIKGSDEQWHSIAVQVDSGAVVTLLRRSTADLLGLSIESGRKVELGGVGGSKVVGHVHDLQLNIGGSLDLVAPCVFALTEEAPNLLGRAGVFDRLQIDFDASVLETRLSPPWLDEDRRRIWETILDICRTIESQWETSLLDSTVETVLKQLYSRGGQLVASAAGLVKLGRAYDCPLILRAMFELGAQFEYLMLKPIPRAKQYLDYEHVSRWLLLQQHLKHPEGPIGQSIANSPLRQEHEPRLRSEFEKVERTFRKGTKGNRWFDSWTCMSLRRLAQEIGREAEYVRHYKRYSGWLHGDPFAAMNPPLSDCDPHDWLTFSYVYYGRVLRRLADDKSIILTNDQYEVLGFLREQVIS